MGRGEDGGPLVKSLKCHIESWMFMLLARKLSKTLCEGNVIKYFREIIFAVLGDA